MVCGVRTTPLSTGNAHIIRLLSKIIISKTVTWRSLLFIKALAARPHEPQGNVCLHWIKQVIDV